LFFILSAIFFQLKIKNKWAADSQNFKNTGGMKEKHGGATASALLWRVDDKAQGKGGYFIG